MLWLVPLFAYACGAAEDAGSSASETTPSSASNPTAATTPSSAPNPATETTPSAAAEVEIPHVDVLSPGSTVVAQVGAAGVPIVIELPPWALECEGECGPEDERPRVPAALFRGELEAGEYTVLIGSAPSKEAPESCNGWTIEGVSRGELDLDELVRAAEAREPLRRQVMGDWECREDGVQALHLVMPEAGPMHFAVTENYRSPRPDAERDEGLCGPFRLTLAAGVAGCGG